MATSPTMELSTYIVCRWWWLVYSGERKRERGGGWVRERKRQEKERGSWKEEERKREGKSGIVRGWEIRVVPRFTIKILWCGQRNVKPLFDVASLSPVPPELGKVEDEIFRNRRDKDLHFKRKAKERRRAAKRSRSVGQLVTPSLVAMALWWLCV